MGHGAGGSLRKSASAASFGGFLPSNIPWQTVHIIVTYLALNSTLNMLNRFTLGHYGFRFPVSLTCAHLLFSLVALAPMMLYAQPYAGTHAETLRRCWRGVACVGVFLALNISLNNASLVHMSLSLNQVFRSSIPVVCAVCAVFVEKRVPSYAEMAALCAVAAGVMICVAGTGSGGEEAANEAVGVGYCAAATLSNALMMTFSGRVMGGEKLDALRLTFYTAPVTLAVLLPTMAVVEAERLNRHLEGVAAQGTLSALCAIVLLGCVNAVTYNYVHYRVINVTSAVTTTVLGNVKVAALILLARVIFGETKSWSWQMLFGSLVALGGFAAYSWVRTQLAARKTQEQSEEAGAKPLLPGKV